MSKERSGYVYEDKSTGKWFARVTFTDSRGKRRNLKRGAEREPKANKLLRKLNTELDAKGESAIDAGKITFADLVEKYKAFKVKPAGMWETERPAVKGLPIPLGITECDCPLHEN